MVAHGQVLLQRLLDRFDSQKGQVSQQAAQKNHIGHAPVAQTLRNFIAWDQDWVDIATHDGPVNHRAVDNQYSTWYNLVLIFVQGWQAHGDDRLGVMHQRRSDFFITDDRRAVGCSTAHFWTIRWDPCNFFT